MKFSHHSSKRSKVKFMALIFVAGFILLAILAAVIVRNSYNDHLKPLSRDSKTHVVTIESGATTADIADMLKSKGVIKSDWAFEWYVRSENLRDKLQAGTFIVNQNQSVQEIVDIIVNGKVATDLVTILPGKRLDEVKAKFIDYGYSKAEVEKAFNPSLYKTHPALIDKPASASLEGYLYPETFQKTANTKLEDIIKLSLDEMQLRLTPDLKQAFAAKGFSTHQAIILASIVEREAIHPEDKSKVAQVFEKRLKENMRLESNATDAYAAIEPNYDTYKIDGLPPGPISNVTESSLNAVAYPAQTDFVYFISGDDGNMYFAKTLDQHKELIKKYCQKGCVQE